MYFKFGDACLLNPLTVVSWCLQQKLIKQGNQFTCWLAWTLAVSLVSKLCCMSVAQRESLWQSVRSTAATEAAEMCLHDSDSVRAEAMRNQTEEQLKGWREWTDRKRESDRKRRRGKNELKVNSRLKNRRNEKVESKTKSTKNLHQDRKVFQQ